MKRYDFRRELRELRKVLPADPHGKEGKLISHLEGDISRSCVLGIDGKTHICFVSGIVDKIECSGGKGSFETLESSWLKNDWEMLCIVTNLLGEHVVDPVNEEE